MDSTTDTGFNSTCLPFISCNCLDAKSNKSRMFFFSVLLLLKPEKKPPSTSLQRSHSLFEHFPREMAMEQPKKVAGGAYGQFLAEKRPELQAECKGQPITAITK